MIKKNKFIYLSVVQGCYPGPKGWEDVSQSEDRREALRDLRAYRANDTFHPYRIIRRREVLS